MSSKVRQTDVTTSYRARINGVMCTFLHLIVELNTGILTNIIQEGVSESLPEHLISLLLFLGSCCSIISVPCIVLYIILCLVVLFLLAIVLSVLFRFTTSKNDFGIFKLFLLLQY